MVYEGEYPVIDMAAFGKNLKRICQEKEISAKMLQEFLHLGTIQAVYMWFRGERLPSLDNFYAISKYLQVEMNELLHPNNKL